MKRHACPNCGGTLGIPDRHDRLFKCSFCWSVIEDQSLTGPTAPERGATLTLTVSTRPVDTGALPTYSAPRSAARWIVIAAVLVMLAAGVAVIVPFFSVVSETAESLGSDPDDGLSGHSIVSGAAIAGEDGATDVVAVTRDDDDYVLHYLDLDAAEPALWHDTLGAESTSNDVHLATADTVYLVAGDRLFAWDRASGDRRFAVTLSDVVGSHLCHDCVQFVGEVLVALTSDGTLTGLDARTGDIRWTHTTTETPRQLLAFGGGAAVLDRHQSPGPAQLEVFDVQRGERTATVPLNCPSTDRGGANVYDHLLPLPDGGFFWEGTDIIEACSQRFAPGATAPTWSSPLSEGGIAVDNSPDIFAVSGDNVVSVHGGTIWSYAMATGTRHQTVRDDEKLSILGQGDGRIYLAAESTRGTASWTILAVDPATGDVAWSFDPGGNPTHALGAGSITTSGWMTVPTEGGLILIDFDDDAETMRFRVLSAGDGTATDAVTVDLGPHAFIVWPSIFGVHGGEVYLGVGTKVLAVDPTTGEIVAEAP